MNYRQPSSATWDAQSVAGVQPSGKTILSEEFARGHGVVAGYPNAQQWPTHWHPWAIDADTLRASWIDASRQVGCVSIVDHTAGGEGSPGQSFCGMYRAAPIIPAGAAKYFYTLYARVLQLGNDRLTALVDSVRFGLFLSFGVRSVDGPFAMAGAVTSQGSCLAGLAGSWQDHATIDAEQELVGVGAGSVYVRMRVEFAAGLGTSVSSDLSVTGEGWQPVFQADYAGPPTFVGFGGSALANTNGPPQGGQFAIDYLRGYEDPLIAHPQLSTDGGSRGG